jgi:hypothetical protein
VAVLLTTSRKRRRTRKNGGRTRMVMMMRMRMSSREERNSTRLIGNKKKNPSENVFVSAAFSATPAQGFVSDLCVVPFFFSAGCIGSPRGEF